MSIRSLVTLLVAAILGLIVVVLVRGYVNASGPDASDSTERLHGTVPVVVAAGPISRGAQLTAAALKVVQFPADGAPVGAFSSTAALLNGQEPRRALRPLSANEPVLSTRVSSATTRLNLSTMLTEGMRAVSVRVNDVAGVGGFVLPGDRVDVLLTRPPDGDMVAVTQVLAENVLVLGVDQSDDDEADEPVVARAVTIEVTPGEAQSISLGGVVGTVSLSLRRIEDQAPQMAAMVTTADLGFPRRRPGTQPMSTGLAPPPRPRAAARAPASADAASGRVEIRVVRGTEASAYAVSH